MITAIAIAHVSSEGLIHMKPFEKLQMIAFNNPEKRQ